MIQIVAQENSNRFSLMVQGHADAGEYGHDIVCAGVSALVTTYANAFMNLLPSMGAAVRLRAMEIEAGNAQIEADVDDGHADCAAVHRAIMDGLDMISQEHPGNVLFTEIGDSE